MGMFAAIARELVAAGISGSELIAALERVESEADAAAERRESRAKPVDDAAERRREYDRNRKSAERLRKSADSADTVPPKEIPHTPLEITPSTELRSEKHTTARVRASRIPEDFVPDMEAAYAAGLSESEALIEVANFLDYWRSKPTNATKLDWPATWRMWCRKATKDRGSMQGRAPPRQQRSQNGFAAFALELAERDYEPADHNDYEPSRNATAGPGDGQARAADRGVDAERPIPAGRARSPAH